MISKQAGDFYNVGQLIELFVQMGCEIRTAERSIETPDGDVFNCRYLINLATGEFQPLLDLADDQSISKWELASWERRLGIIVPKPH